MKNRPQDHDQALRQHLLYLLNGGGAHVSFDSAVEGLEPKLRGKTPAGFQHSAWMLLEHMRMTQWDILEFSRSAKHVSPEWPAGYWPAGAAPPSATSWSAAIRKFHGDLKAMKALLTNSRTDLFAPLAWGDGQTVLREALLVADHNAYHLGQLVDVRRALGAWPGA
jgi:DinB superfamily